MVHVSTLTGAQHCNWESVRVERIGEGIERQMIVGDQLMYAACAWSHTWTRRLTSILTNRSR
jgi:hypothetical protein